MCHNFLKRVKLSTQVGISCLMISNYQRLYQSYKNINIFTPNKSIIMIYINLDCILHGSRLPINWHKHEVQIQINLFNLSFKDDYLLIGGDALAMIVVIVAIFIIFVIHGSLA
ncbi:hypothetical protein ACJX0J_019090 [Zea mays]